MLCRLPEAECSTSDAGLECQSPRDLASLGHIVVGVDGSPQQVVRARQNVPQATFVEADMCNVAFDASSFHAVGAFYSITHVPPRAARTAAHPDRKLAQAKRDVGRELWNRNSRRMDRRMARDHDVLRTHR